MSDRPRQIITAAHVERASELVFLRGAAEIAQHYGARVTTWLLHRLIDHVEKIPVVPDDAKHLPPEFDGSGHVVEFGNKLVEEIERDE